MNGNLFTDVYDVSRTLFGRDAEDMESAERCRKEVFNAVGNDMVPDRLRYLMFKMTNYCNSDCAYCSHAVNSKSNEKKSQIPFHTIQRTIREAGGLGASAMSINGGEPLLMPFVEEVVTEAVSQKITPVLMTNGLLLPGKWEGLAERGLRYIILSFDSLNPEVFEKQRGVKYEDAYRGLEAAVEMMKKYPDAQIHVTAVLTRENMNELPGFVREMSGRGICVQISPYHHYNPHQPDHLSIADRAEAQRITDILLDLKAEGYKIGNSSGFLAHVPSFFADKKRIPDGYHCLVGYTNLFIDAYMNARPCWASCFEPVGNIGRESLKEIWYGDKMRKYRRQMLRSECEGCWYLCTGEVTMFLNNALDAVACSS